MATMPSTGARKRNHAVSGLAACTAQARIGSPAAAVLSSAAKRALIGSVVATAAAAHSSNG
jgi:hypothetical protein